MGDPCQSPQHLHCHKMIRKTAEASPRNTSLLFWATCDKHDVMHCNTVTWFHLYHSPPITKYIIPPSHLPSENFWASIMIWIYYKPERQEFRLGPHVVVIWFSFLSHCPVTLLNFNLVGCRKLRWQNYSRRLPHPDNNISTAKTHFIKSDTHNILPSVSNETAMPFLLTHSPHFPLSRMPGLHKAFISCLTFCMFIVLISPACISMGIPQFKTFFALTPNITSSAVLPGLGLQQSQKQTACCGPKGLHEITIVLAIASRVKTVDHSMEGQIT